MKRSVLFAAGLGCVLAFSSMAQQTYDYKNKRGDAVDVSRDTKNGQGTVDKTVTGPDGKTATVDKSINGDTATKVVTGPNGKTKTTTHKRRHRAAA